jgi:predicted ATPase/class 3 adenylate cyclase
MGQLPAGTVTFLFTDIEGSTRLLDDLGAEAYASALAEHRRVLREAFERHGGIEVDIQGDAFFVAFPTAPGGLAAAREAQEALSLPVRMGIHTGTPLLTEEGYVGSDVHRAARIAAAAHGRQVLVSSSTAALLEPGTGELLDLGEHRLKDLGEPERIYQAGGGEFPPLRSLHRTNLPVPQTPFLGRARELHEVTALLTDGARVLTLAGPGGTGKTRLALQAAAESADDFSEGVFWVPLAPLADSGLVLPAVAEAVGAPVPEGRDVPATLAGKRMLVLLDNAEHLLPAVANDVAALSAIEGPTLLVTSRERLGLQAERLYDVQSLLPRDAVELFLTRAAALDVPVERSDAVVELCERLDNLPLAIELAAPRLRLFSPDQLLERLSTRLDLFEGPRDADPRQRTLRATIEWSYDLLEPAEQRLFAAFSVFAGGASYEAVEAVCGAEPGSLQSLVDKSLVRRRADGGEPRFWMLETIQEFAAERLEDDAVSRAHVDYFGSLVQKLGEDSGAAEHAALARESANIRAALNVARESGDTENQLRLLAGAEEIFLGGSHGAFAAMLKEALAAPAEEPLLRARGEGILAFVEYRRGEYGSAKAAAKRALALAEQLSNYRLVASALSSLASVAAAEGNLDEARRLLEQALEVNREAGNTLGIATTVLNLGDHALVAGDYERSVELTTEAIRLDRDRGGSLLQQVGLVNLAGAYVALDRIADAEEAAADSLAVDVGIRDPLAVVFCLRVFAAAAARRGETERAGLLLGAADGLDAEVGAASDPSQSALRDDVAHRLTKAIGAAETEGLVERGRELSADDAVALALAKT